MDSNTIAAINNILTNATDTSRRALSDCLSLAVNYLFKGTKMYCRCSKYFKARIFLLVDLREFFFRFRVGGGDEKNK